MRVSSAWTQYLPLPSPYAVRLVWSAYVLVVTNQLSRTGSITPLDVPAVDMCIVYRIGTFLAHFRRATGQGEMSELVTAMRYTLSMGLLKRNHTQHYMLYNSPQD